MKKDKRSHQTDSSEVVNQTISTYHIPVMLDEVIDALDIKPDGVYVDCTFGGGGHSRAILEKLNSKGRLIAFDQDADAQRNLPDDARLLFIPQNFRHLQRFLRLHNVDRADGLLADLGVSSFQFDEASRGFSTRFDAALDMRMDQRQEVTAMEVLNTYPVERLQLLFSEFGEVTNARTLASKIAGVRKVSGLKTIDGFKAAIHGVVKGNPNKYLAQVFQALRIEVNDEVGALKELLEQIPGVLKTGGRVAVITFHSLEDRLVKLFFRDGAWEQKEENPFINTEVARPLKLFNKKPMVATADEMKRNPRSRSAKLRVAEKIDT